MFSRNCKIPFEVRKRTSLSGKSLLAVLWWWPGVIVTSGIISCAWGCLVYKGTISTIWPLFGTANQLLSTMALAISTTFLLHQRKARYAWVTAVPMAFLAATTISFTLTSLPITFPKEKPCWL